MSMDMGWTVLLGVSRAPLLENSLFFFMRLSGIFLFRVEAALWFDRALSRVGF